MTPIVLAFDTATPETVVALAAAGAVRELRHAPAAGERPGHAQELLALANELLAQGGLGWRELDRIGVGVGPGTFTGLRIGVATARALAQSSGAELVAVSTLRALALAAGREQAGPVLAVLDAKRGEAFIAAWHGDEQLLAPAAVAPDQLGARIPSSGSWVAVGDGAVRFRTQLEAAGAAVPADDSPLHLVSGAALCALASAGIPVELGSLVPEYIRAPDAELRAGSGAR